MKLSSSRTVLILFLALITIPYLIAQLQGGAGYTFGGFLLNPGDGNSYLAKMYEGWSGSWQFTLPFTAEVGDGAYLFLFYIFLGHLSRLTGLSLILTYHIARVLGALIMAYGLMSFIDWVFEQDPSEVRRGFLLSLFGSGLGWLLIAFGLTTSDLWVAEAFPFLSGFTSPHFSMGIGIALLLMMMIARPVRWQQWPVLAGLGLLLSIIMPFGIVVTGLVSVVWAGWEWRRSQHLRWQPIVAAFCLGGPFLLYQYWVIQANPLLSAWNAQNLTPSPPVWDLFVSLLPAFIAATWAVWRTLKRGEENSANRLVITWFVVGLLMIYFPFSLQRRFMFACFIPVSILAVAGLREMPTFLGRIRKNAFSWLLGGSVITNAVVILLTGFGIATHSPLIYLSKDEMAAFDYLRNSAQASSIVLCAPETGALIPAWTGLRVLYGHPFETVQATQMKDLVDQLFSSDLSTQKADEILNQQRVRFIFWGPQERSLGQPAFIQHLKPVYLNDTVEIYSW